MAAIVANMKLSERFSIQKELGSGATGRVFVAMDNQLGREVALKLMRRTTGDKPEEDFLRRLMVKEASFLALLEHPNVLPIYDYFDSSEGPVLVLRRAHGTLNDHAKGSASDEGTVHRLLRQVAEAVDFCADSGFAHRDLKPSNVMVDVSGHAYLGDFGFAARFDDASKWDDIVGTPPFIAPELVHRERATHSADIRSRCDLFSYGVTAYCMLTGGLPFPGSHGPQESTALRLIRGERPMPVHQLNPGLPGPIDQVIDRLLQVDPAARYPSATAAWKDLDDVLQGRAKSKCPLFVSYSHRDETPVTGIIEALVREGYPVWWDKHLSVGTKPWARMIEVAMQESQLMLLMVSSSSVTREEVFNEWSYFRRDLKKPVIPVLLDGTAPPYQLAPLQRINVCNRPASEAARIISREIVRLIECRGDSATPAESIAKPLQPGTDEKTHYAKRPTEDEKTRIIRRDGQVGAISIVPSVAPNPLQQHSHFDDHTMIGGKLLSRQLSPDQVLQKQSDFGMLTMLPARPDYFELEEGETRIVHPKAPKVDVNIQDSTDALAWDYPEDITWLGGARTP